MQTDDGGWVWRDGVSVMEPRLERGRLLFRSPMQTRARIRRYILRMGVLLWAIFMLIYTFLAIWHKPMLEVHILTAMALVFLLVSLAAIYGYFSVITVMPGIHEHGIELYPHGFVPYEEVASISRMGPWLGGTLIITLKGSGKRYELARTIYGTDGTKHVEDRVKGEKGRLEGI